MPQEGFLKKNEEGQPIMPQEWRLRDGIIPTISLDLGVHVHHLIQFLTGEQPLSVVAQHRSYGNFNGLTDDISVLAEYTNNVSAILWYSKAALGFRNGLKIRIFGDAGSAEWVQENPETIMYYKNKGQKLILDRGSNGVVVANQKRYTRFKVGHPAGYIEAFANYYYDLAHDLSHYIDHKKLPESKYTFGIRESIESMRFLEAVSRSARTRSWEPVS